MNIEEGEILLGHALSIRPGLTEESFRAIAGDMALPLVHNGPSRSYKLPSVDLLGRSFQPSVYFTAGKVTAVSLYPEADDPTLSAKDQNKANARWLRTTLGGFGVRRFSWGTIEPIYDPRSDSADIWLRYRDHPR